MPSAVDARLLDDYKIHVQALANHYGRLWTRFNVFITIHTALMVALVGLFKDTGLTGACDTDPNAGRANQCALVRHGSAGPISGALLPGDGLRS